MTGKAWIALGIVVIVVGIALSLLLLPLGYSIGIVLIVLGAGMIWFGFRRQRPDRRTEGESPGGGSS